MTVEHVLGDFVPGEGSPEPIEELLYWLLDRFGEGQSVPGGKQAIIQISFAAKEMENGMEVLITALAVALHKIEQLVSREEIHSDVVKGARELLKDARGKKDWDKINRIDDLLRQLVE